MKLSPTEAPRFSWGKVWGLNYKFKDQKTSILYAKLEEPHGEVSTTDQYRYYYILTGEGEFTINSIVDYVSPGDVIQIPPQTKYNYRPLNESLEVLLFMEYWDSTKWEK
jgi:mannose-6-phosphate isomerase-like protein (cupin superfamily)